MKEAEVLIIGASMSGLACAATIQKKGLKYHIIEKSGKVVNPWRNHYDRLHLHTNKSLSNLPYKKFTKEAPTYPTRLQVVEYVDNYAKEFNINPDFNTEATSVKRENGYWITKTNKETYKSKYVIAATGAFGQPKMVDFKGMETFPGTLTHSYGYKSGKDFKGQKVLVVGFGNSACEIALDLHEQGAKPSMSVRSAVNILPRDVFGIPILFLGVYTRYLPPRLVDTLNKPLFNFLLGGDVTKFGLKKLPYGPVEQVHKHGKIPLLDIGTLQLIKDGNCPIFEGIDHIDGHTVHFKDGKQEKFDAIVAGIGYYQNHAEFIEVDKSRFEDLRVELSKQKYFGKDGLYFCGFYVSPSGQIREITLDAKKIAKDIASKN